MMMPRPAYIRPGHNGQQLAYVYFEDEPSASLFQTRPARAARRAEKATIERCYSWHETKQRH